MARNRPAQQRQPARLVGVVPGRYVGVGAAQPLPVGAAQMQGAQQFVSIDRRIVAQAVYIDQRYRRAARGAQATYFAAAQRALPVVVQGVARRAGR